MHAQDTLESLPARRLSLEEPLLGADEVGRLLAVPRSSVYDYARRCHNPLPSIRVGRHLRFFLGDVERWVDDQRSRDRERASAAATRR